MTIDEAITCLAIQCEVKHRLGKDFEAQALKLGIEALKREKLHREEGHFIHFSLLSGETEE